MPTKTRGACRECGAKTQADRTLCKPGMGCRKEIQTARSKRREAARREAARPRSGPPRAPQALPPAAPQAPQASRPEITAAMVAAKLGEAEHDALIDAAAQVLEEPSLWNVKKLKDVARDLVLGAIEAAVAERFEAKEAARVRQEHRYYRLPAQRAWTNRRRLGVAEVDRLPFYLTEAEYDARQAAKKAEDKPEGKPEGKPAPPAPDPTLATRLGVPPPGLPTWADRLSPPLPDGDHMVYASPNGEVFLTDCFGKRRTTGNRLRPGDYCLGEVLVQGGRIVEVLRILGTKR